MLNINYFFSNKKKFLCIATILFFCLDLLQIFILGVNGAYKYMHKHNISNINDSDITPFALIFKILSNFSVKTILESAGYELSNALSATVFLCVVPVAIFLWILWPKFLLEQHQGWLRLYLAVSAILGVSIYLLFYSHNSLPFLHPRLIILIFIGIVIGGLFVMCLRWIFSGFEKKENV